MEKRLTPREFRVNLETAVFMFAKKSVRKEDEFFHLTTAQIRDKAMNIADLLNEQQEEPYSQLRLESKVKLAMSRAGFLNDNSTNRIVYLLCKQGKTEEQIRQEIYEDRNILPEPTDDNMVKRKDLVDAAINQVIWNH